MRTVDRKPSVRPGRLSLVVILALTVAVQMSLGMATASWTVPSLIPAVLVAGCGLLLPLFGSWLLTPRRAPLERGYGPEPATRAGALIGALALAAAGFAWVAGGVGPSAKALRFKLQDEAAANRLAAAVRRLPAAGPCIHPADLPALSGYGRPASVCIGPDWLVIRMSPGHESLGLAATAAAFPDECVRHLDRHWWALADPTPDCPLGYRFVPGP